MLFGNTFVQYLHDDPFAETIIQRLRMLEIDPSTFIAFYIVSDHPPDFIIVDDNNIYRAPIQLINWCAVDTLGMAWSTRWDDDIHNTIWDRVSLDELVHLGSNGFETCPECNGTWIGASGQPCSCDHGIVSSIQDGEFVGNPTTLSARIGTILQSIYFQSPSLRSVLSLHSMAILDEISRFPSGGGSLQDLQRIFSLHSISNDTVKDTIKRLCYAGFIQMHGQPPNVFIASRGRAVLAVLGIDAGRATIPSRVLWNVMVNNAIDRYIAGHVNDLRSDFATSLARAMARDFAKEIATQLGISSDVATAPPPASIPPRISRPDNDQ